MQLADVHIAATMSGVAVRVQCPSCERRVYPMESQQIEGATFHKRCVRCNQCKSVVSLGNLAMYGGVIYCKPHFKERFLARGTYAALERDGDQRVDKPAFGGGQWSLSTRTSSSSS
ncbi:LIM zinc-binding domain-containing protein [Plasmodiophora brassicae]|nr:hypothetical protein PBRA_009285 [Plasmodiophora brassicae]